jgi:hypothetical protein
VFGKRVGGVAVANDEMIEHSDVDQVQCLRESLGEIPVGLAGFAPAGGVVVGDNHLSCPVAAKFVLKAFNIIVFFFFRMNNNLTGQTL